MPGFRQQPLTWLFFLATACLDAVALSLDHESTFANSLVLGQLFVASGWLVLGRSHRLARAAIFVATIAALTLPDYALARLRHRPDVDYIWPHVLAVLILMGIATVATTLCWTTIARLTSRGLRPFQRADWQFTVAELLGWMIVVAVVCVGVQRADFSLIDGPKDITLGLGAAMIAGAVMTLAVDESSRRPRSIAFAAVLAGLIVTVNALILGRALPVDEQNVLIGSLVYAACWAFVRRIDGRTKAVASAQDSQSAPAAS
jgi:hypothetical protein